MAVSGDHADRDKAKETIIESEPDSFETVAAGDDQWPATESAENSSPEAVLLSEVIEEILEESTSLKYFDGSERRRAEVMSLYTNRLKSLQAEDELPEFRLPSEEGNPGMTNHIETIDRKTYNHIVTVVTYAVVFVVILTVLVILFGAVQLLVLLGADADLTPRIQLVGVVVATALAALATFILKLRK